MNILSCGKCILQHFLACSDPAHFDAHRVAVKFYLGIDVDSVYAGFLGDPQASIWALAYVPAVQPTAELVEA